MACGSCVTVDQSASRLIDDVMKSTKFHVCYRLVIVIQLSLNVVVSNSALL